MGFSVSGATVVIMIGFLISFGIAYSATATTVDRFSDAQSERADRMLDLENTAIEIENATYDAENPHLLITVANIGSTDLSVERTTLLLDGEYVDPDSTEIEEVGETSIWLSGERLILEIDDLSEKPDRIKIVTEHGVSDLTDSIDEVNT